MSIVFPSQPLRTVTFNKACCLVPGRLALVVASCSAATDNFFNFLRIFLSSKAEDDGDGDGSGF